MKATRDLCALLFAATLMASLVPLAAKAAPDLRRYPDPQFARTSWLSLNGSWRFAWDDQNVGLAQGWQSGRASFPKTIQVPFPPESALSGVNERGEHAVSWYAREFEVPHPWRGRRLLLKVGASHYLTRAWVNGELVGEHRGGQTPFKFDVTRALRPRGPNSIVFRVEHPPFDQFIARGKQHWQAKPEGIFYTRSERNLAERLAGGRRFDGRSELDRIAALRCRARRLRPARGQASARGSRSARGGQRRGSDVCRWRWRGGAR